MRRVSNLTPWHGALPDPPVRMDKRIFLRDKYSIDGEDATQMLTVGTFKEREQWVDTLPMSICFEGQEGMEETFIHWLREKRTNEKKANGKKA